MTTRVPNATARTLRAARTVGQIAFAAVLLLFAAVALRFTFGGTEPAFRNYGVIDTRLGVAVVACGGEASRGCGEDTALRFASCSAPFHAFFDNSPFSDDELVRTLIHKRPPSGERWIVECGGAAAMIHGQRPAQLRSN
jgi:hypothetical protein